MIKVATVFSGIGAPEWALKVGGFEYENVFACDNGDIVLKNLDYDKELTHIRSLNNVKSKKDYVDKLFSNKVNYVKKSYMANHKIIDDNFFQDIKLLDGTDFRGKVDILIGGSPCQSFSAKGKRESLRGKSGLFFEFIRILEEVSPDMFVFENVKNMIHIDNGETWDIIKAEFSRLGYHYKCEVLNAADYGIPQQRNRVFVVGFKDINRYIRFRFPNREKLNIKVQDLLISSVGEGGVTYEKCKVTVNKAVSPDIVPTDTYLTDRALVWTNKRINMFKESDYEVDRSIAKTLTTSQSRRIPETNYYNHNRQVKTFNPTRGVKTNGI